MDTYDFLFSLLGTPLVVPPDLRSALVRALAYTADARLIDDRLDFHGRPAALIDVPTWGSDLVIDRYTYEPLGSRWVLGPADMGGRNRMFNASRARGESPWWRSRWSTGSKSARKGGPAEALCTHWGGECFGRGVDRSSQAMRAGEGHEPPPSRSRRQGEPARSPPRLVFTSHPG